MTKNIEKRRKTGEFCAAKVLFFPKKSYDETSKSEISVLLR
jgi:hypothetical protein